MSKAKPWVVDASEVHGEDQDSPGDQLVHETEAIREFLSLDGPDRLYVVAPKGYGKTLLLQAKRMLLQRKRGGLLLSPSGQLVDRPPGALPIWTREQLGGFVGTYEYWVEVWELAIRIAAVKLFRRHSGQDDGPPDAGIRSPRLREILAKPQFVVLSEVFMQILHLERREFYALRQDVVSHLNPLFRGIHTGIAFFIDNVDECLERSPRGPRAGEPRAADRGERGLPEPWTLAQLALARASFDTNRLNPHVRVYAALRREAWLRLGDFDAGAAQMNGRMVEIRYGREDLRQIFLRNIAAESPDRLRDPAHTDPLARLVGAENVTVAHDLTGGREDFIDFALRHTLLRPRELMAIGSQIALVPPPQRGVARLKEAVRRAAADNVRYYRAEMGRFLPVPDRAIFQLIDRNALGAEDVARITGAYNRSVDPSGLFDDEQRQPFTALYRMGLLGVIRGAGEASPGGGPGEHQSFVPPDEIVFEERPGALPRSRRYLVHPALDALVEQAHGADYARNSDRRNVVGAMLPWADESIAQFVVAGDIAGSGETAWNPDYSATYPAMFAAWVDEVCEAHGVRHHEVTGGDSVLMVDASAARLLLAARHLLARMQRLREHRRTMRFGGAYGVVRGIDEARAGGTAPATARQLTGAVLATATRLEKAARQGTVLATDAFWEGARGGWDETTAARVGSDFKGFRSADGGRFVVQKTREDPGVVTGLWRIRLLADE